MTAASAAIFSAVGSREWPKRASFLSVTEGTDYFRQPTECAMEALLFWSQRRARADTNLMTNEDESLLSREVNLVRMTTSDRKQKWTTARMCVHFAISKD